MVGELQARASPSCELLAIEEVKVTPDSKFGENALLAPFRCRLRTWLPGQLSVEHSLPLLMVLRVAFRRRWFS